MPNVYFIVYVLTDSPKKKPVRRLSRGKSAPGTSSLRRNKKKITVPLSSTGHNIVVVKEGAAQPSKSQDPELLKLQVRIMWLL